MALYEAFQIYQADAFMEATVTPDKFTKEYDRYAPALIWFNKHNCNRRVALQAAISVYQEVYRWDEKKMAFSEKAFQMIIRNEV